MASANLVILRGDDVRLLMEEREKTLIELVQRAYETHARGESSLPHSSFVRFRAESPNRVIALPCYLGGDTEAAGVKWIASFPENVRSGMERASAVIILNSATDGRPFAVLEGAQISAKRTAASAALAARHLGGSRPYARVGFIGCGLISLETARFLASEISHVASWHLFDLDVERARRFRARCERRLGLRDVRIETSSEAVLATCPLTTIATTAVAPHIDDLSVCVPGGTILHVSLRDLSPHALLRCANVVDDVDHVCRAETSVHLAEKVVGHRRFIRGTLAEVLFGRVTPRENPEQTVVFSPFGLGVLDVAVAKWVYAAAREKRIGVVIESFIPESEPEPLGADTGSDVE